MLAKPNLQRALLFGFPTPLIAGAPKRLRFEQRASGRGVLVPSDLAGLLGPSEIIAVIHSRKTCCEARLSIRDLAKQGNRVWLKSRRTLVPAADGYPC